MYEAYWKLNECPFGSSAAARFVYDSPVHREAVARLEFVVQHNRSLAIVNGPVGCGKTTLLRIFRQQVIRTGSSTALLSLIGLSRHDFMRTLADELCLPSRDGDSEGWLWRKISDQLKVASYQQQSTVILLDDAAEALPEVLPAIHRLLQMDHVAEGGLTIVMATDAAKLPRLGPRLLQRSDLRIDLEQWSCEEVNGYLRESIQRAGGDPTIFPPETAARLFELSTGVPRRVRQLADLTLLASAGEASAGEASAGEASAGEANQSLGAGQSPAEQVRAQIDPELIESVYHELCISANEALATSLSQGERAA